MRKIGIFYIYIFFASAVFFSNIELLAEGAPKVLRLRLKDVLDIAIINNFDIRLAKYDRAIKDTDIGDALSIYDTVLELEAEYTHDALEKSS
ncbi:MAG: hypothetical protein U9R52_04180, partial [Candidatus Omnitrophota bacterium]|nr:hypothetical protein [Candidatus Omnitrophota bacterium]